MKDPMTSSSQNKRGPKKRSPPSPDLRPFLNPYEPPSSAPWTTLLWDRSVLTQIGFGIHLLILLAYSFFTVDSELTPSEILGGIDPRIHLAMAGCSGFSFMVVFTATITQRSWPLHQRSCLIGIDLLMIGISGYISQGFGSLSQ